MTKERETVVTVVTSNKQQQVLEPTGAACLVVYYGQQIGRRFFLDKPELVIGRSDTTDVRVDQDSVSRQHASIKLESHRYMLQDLGSTNGTFINDMQIEKRALQDGDLIRIGQTIFKYLSGSNIETKYHEEIYHLAATDGLTGAHNHRFFLEALEHELYRSVRYERWLSLIMIDIDHFKKLNDTRSHLAGDDVLRRVGKIIGQKLRREDVFARYGGEEFAILLPEIDLEGAAQVAEKTRMLVEQYPFEFDNATFSVTISLGVSSTDGKSKDMNVTQFIAQADAKLYEAKHSGRNCVRY